MTANEWTTTATGEPGPAMAACLQAATAAPSIHNTQPWLFRIRDDGVDVLVDPRRRLAVADPAGREMHLSVGAALFNLRVAMLDRGHQPRIALLPDPAEPDLVATVTIGPAVPVDETTRRLAATIPRRHTSRRPFGSTPIPAPTLADLEAACRAEGAHLLAPGSTIRERILHVVRRAEERQRADADYRSELADWTAGRGRTDGIPAAAFGPRPELVAVPVRDFDPDRVHPRPVARYEKDPTIAVLYTDGDTRADWLRAGQALERLLLTATDHGLVGAPLTQAIAVAELRALLPAPGAAQSVLRLGYGGQGAATPRRPLTDVVPGDDRPAD